MWLEEVARDVTALGGTTFLVAIVLAVAGYLFLRRSMRSGWLVLVAGLGAHGVISLSKALFDRPRPQLVAHDVAVYTQSLPSGHAAGSAAVFLTLAAILASLDPRRAVKTYVLAWAILVTVVVGATRVYLGVHWPTDVLAGWALGAAWAALWWALFRVGRGPRRT